MVSMGLQLLQMLCPLRQKVMGGSMYSMHTGHSSSPNRPMLRSAATHSMEDLVGFSKFSSGFLRSVSVFRF